MMNFTTSTIILGWELSPRPSLLSVDVCKGPLMCVLRVACCL